MNTHKFFSRFRKLIVLLELIVRFVKVIIEIYGTVFNYLLGKYRCLLKAGLIGTF